MMGCFAQSSCRGRVLVLPQLNVSVFVDSLWEALPFLRSGWGWIGWEGEVGGEGAEMVIVM